MAGKVWFQPDAPDAGTTYAWEGEAGKSVSIRYENGVETRRNLVPNPSFSTLYYVAATGTTIDVDSVWDVDGGTSLRITPTSATNNDSFAGVGGDIGGVRMGMVPGGTYTTSATIRLVGENPMRGSYEREGTLLVFTRRKGGGFKSNNGGQPPNAPGDYEQRLSFTLPDDVTDAFIRLYHGGVLGNGPVWWDSFMLTEGNYSGPYFDGDTPDDRADDVWINPVTQVLSRWEKGVGWKDTYEIPPMLYLRADTGWEPQQVSIVQA